MHNLLPEEWKKNVSREYRFRLLSIFFFSLSFSLFSGIIFLLPTYLLSSVEKRSADQDISFYQNLEKGESFAGQISALQEKLALLNPLSRGGYVSEIFEIALKEAPEGISIKGLSFVPGGATASSTLSLSGVADKREDLLAFKKRLEEGGNFSKIDLPVNIFTKSRDISFSFTATILR